MKKISKMPPLSIQLTHPRFNWEILKYTFTSLIATVCDFSIFSILNDKCHFATLYALWIGQIVGSIVTFILLYNLVFRNQKALQT